MLVSNISFCGVTIHYSGNVSDIKNVEKIYDISKKYAEEKKWKISQFNNGYTIYPAEWCEPLNIKFSGKKLSEDFVKTQFAGIDIHIEILGLFTKIKPFMQKLNVIDEGEYWETKNKETLKVNFEFVTKSMAQIKSQHPSAKGPTKLPDGRIIDLHR